MMDYSTRIRSKWTYKFKGINFAYPDIEALQGLERGPLVVLG